MSLSGSQNQTEVPQGKSCAILVQRGSASNINSGLLPRGPDDEEISTQTFDDSSSHVGAPGQPVQVRIVSTLPDNVALSISALDAGLGRTPSPNFRSPFSSYGPPVWDAGQPPQPDQLDGLSDDFYPVHGTLMQPETSLIDIGGHFSIHQLDLLDSNLLAMVAAGNEAAPGS